MTDLPPPGARGPRRGLTPDEATVAKMLDQARDSLRRADDLAAEAERARADLARRCAELHDAGLSIAQIAKGLDITPARTQRLIDQGRR